MSTHPAAAHRHSVTTAAILATVFTIGVSPQVGAADTEPLRNAFPDQMLAAVGRRIVILAKDGTVAREIKTEGLVHDAWLLPSGNVLYANGKAVAEVTPEGTTVFEYRAKVQEGGGTYACQRLDNGNTFIGENSTGRLVEVDSSGKIVAEVQAQGCVKGKHHNLRMVRKLKNGNILACHSGAKRVVEYASDGTVVWEFTPPKAGLAYTALRLDNGNTMVSVLNRVAEFSPDGTVAWEFTNKDIPGATITNMTGFHLLANGNLVIGCYAAFDKQTKQGILLFEITRGKQLVWSYSRHDLGGTCLAVQRLDGQGRALPGSTTR